MADTFVGIERRNCERSKVFLGAQLRVSEYFEPAECVVRDISAFGARLQLRDGRNLPRNVNLFIPSRNVRVTADVTWRHDNFVGVAFVSIAAPASPDGVTQEPLPRALRRTA